MAQKRIKATVIRLSTQPNQNGSYAYSLVNTDETLKPRDLKMYGKEGTEYENKIFYLNKLIGTHEKPTDIDIAYVQRTSTRTGEVSSQIIALRSEQEVRSYEQSQRQAQEASKQARLFGISKQQVGTMAMDRILDNIYGTKTVAVTNTSASSVEDDDEETETVEKETTAKSAK